MKLKPSLRQKKRYVAFVVESDERISKKEIIDAILKTVHSFLGINISSELDLWIIEYNEEEQKGFLVVNNKKLGILRACLALISEINGKKVRVRVLGVSGTIKSLRRKFLNNKILVKKVDLEARFMNRKIKICREFNGCIDALPYEDIAEYVKKQKLMFIGLTKEDIEER